MFTSTEKKYLILTVFFLATGTGIKAFKHSKVKIGPMLDSTLVVRDSLEILSAKTQLDSTSNSEPSSVLSSASNLDSTPAEPNSLTQSNRKPGSRARPGSAPAHKAAFIGKLSINLATQVELTAISGLGAKTAQFIVKYRNEHGPFRDLKELLQIKGIGEKKLEKFRPFLIL